ncbi:DUF3047 domain-containing protein [Balneolaceae bacterium YR4-1]|uniref:DUF3047 domain-containing protein n=1 Tax=Halalkalibaculum roseum TaxID=2709311 RepID=A0A6M1SX38_9BACT|nr:DUF3047 domain-containing protein [Halalkalibaculum roseum]NGP76778.1 DUF3047 domain-containing protein [Halalkalibaculum roseum]
MIKRLRYFQFLITLFCAGALLGLFSLPVLAQNGPERIDEGIILLEDFQEDSVGQFPIGWYDRNGNKTLKNHDPKVVEDYNYRILSEDSNKFLRYEGTSAKHINYPLINKKKENIYGIDIYKTPILSWKVRAYSLPNNGNEDSSDRNDVVASVYVVFDFGRVALFKKVPKSIRYTWSTTLKEGTRTSKLFGNQQIVVVESGSENTGKWIKFERNIVEDYRRLFGDDPPRTPLAILILSDGDSTGSFVKADYDDIMLKSP